MKLNVTKNFFNSAEILHVLGSETRLRILQLIHDKSFSIKDLAAKMDCGASNISQQLQVLEYAGLIKKVKIKDGSTTKLVKPIYDKIEISF